MNADDMKTRAIYDASQIADYTPNLIFDFTSAINPTSSAAAIYIRGVGQPDWSLPTDPGVGLYLDGVYIARSVGGVLDVVDVANVEILRGPQGTLFGRNTIGGAINIVSKQPSDELSADVELGVGSFGRMHARGHINVPISDKAAISATLSSKTADGFIKNEIPGQPDWGDEDSLAYRVALKIDPTENFSVSFTYDATRERETHTSNIHFENHEDAFLPLVYNGVLTASTIDPDTNEPAIASDPTRYGRVPDAVCADIDDASRLTNPTCFNSQWTVSRSDPYRTYGVLNTKVPELLTDASKPLSPAADLDLDGFSINASWSISETLDLVSITSFRSLDGFWSRDEDGSPMEIVATVNDFDQEQTTQEFQLKGIAKDGALHWIAGAFFFEEDGCHLDLVYLYGATFSSGGCIDNKSQAIFVQGTYDFSEDWSLTLGGRYTDEEKSFAADQVVSRDELFGSAKGDLLLPTAPAKVDVDETNFHINLARHFSSNTMGYVSFSDSFKGATFTQRIFPPRDVVPIAQPEFVETYEIGFKTTFANGRARLNGAYFDSDYTDIQVTVLESANAGTTTANAASGDIRGFELELYAAPIDNLKLELGLGYLDAGYSKVGGIAEAAGLSPDFDFVNAPEWSLNSAISYDFRLNNGWNLSPRLEYNYNSEIYNDSQNNLSIRQKGIGIINASVSITTADERWTIRAVGKNLGDKLVIISGFSDPFFTGATEATVLTPRTGMLSAEYKFN